MTAFRVVSVALLAAASVAFGQDPSVPQQPTNGASTAAVRAHGRSAKGDIGSGSADVGKGAGRGAGNLAAGTGKGAADVATLHPVEGAGAIGKGGAKAGKNVGVGAAKGTGKIAKGTGKAVKKIF